MSFLGVSVELLDDFTFQGSENWKPEDLLTFWGVIRGTFGMITLFKSLKNGNLSALKKWKGFRVNPMELLESDSMPWNFWKVTQCRGVPGPPWNFWGNVEK